MAIRLRGVDGTLVALCAARTRPETDDVYLDDAQHYALAAKFDRDHKERFIDFQPEGAIMARVEAKAPVCATFSACEHEECHAAYMAWLNGGDDGA